MNIGSPQRHHESVPAPAPGPDFVPEEWPEPDPERQPTAPEPEKVPADR